MRLIILSDSAITAILHAYFYHKAIACCYRDNLAATVASRALIGSGIGLNLMGLNFTFIASDIRTSRVTSGVRYGLVSGSIITNC